MIKSLDGPSNDFKAAATFLLPADPVAKRRSAKKPIVADVSNTSAVAPSTHGSMKIGRDKTGVDLRWHTKAKYFALSSKAASGTQ